MEHVGAAGGRYFCCLSAPATTLYGVCVCVFPPPPVADYFLSPFDRGDYNGSEKHQTACHADLLLRFMVDGSVAEGELWRMFKDSQLYPSKSGSKKTGKVRVPNPARKLFAANLAQPPVPLSTAENVPGPVEGGVPCREVEYLLPGVRAAPREAVQAAAAEHNHAGHGRGCVGVGGPVRGWNAPGFWGGLHARS